MPVQQVSGAFARVGRRECPKICKFNWWLPAPLARRLRIKSARGQERRQEPVKMPSSQERRYAAAP